MTLGFGEMVGEFPKVVTFMELNDQECITRVISLGSYAYLNSSESEDRIFHLDLYEPGQHSTLDFYEGQPDLEQIAERAFALFSE